MSAQEPWDELPEELAELERALAQRPRPVPSPELRRRVYSAVTRGPDSRIWLAAAAASLLVALSLRESPARDGAFRIPRHLDAAESAPSVPLPGIDGAEFRRATFLATHARVPRLAPLLTDSYPTRDLFQEL